MNRISKYIVLVIFILSSYNLVGSDKNINIYGSILSTPGIIEINIEYNLLSFDLLGIQSITGIRAGSSLFGFQGVSTRFSSPVVGIVQYFGRDSGFDLGISYLKNNNAVTVSFFDGGSNDPPRIDKNSDKYIRFDVGYRDYFSSNGIFRFSFVPFAEYEKLSKHGNWELQYLISVSVGYSF